MPVRALEESDVADWDAYVTGHSRATFFHLTGWRDVLERSYRLECHYILAERDGAICGILPMAVADRPLLGRALISTPFCVYGGIVADDADTEAALEAAAVDMARALGARYIELRNLAPALNRDTLAVVPDDGQFFTFRRPLARDDDANLKAVPRKQRAVIRHAMQRGGYSVEVERASDAFYALYRDSVHRLGTPVYRRTLFDAILSVFGDAAEILTIYLNDAAQCSVLTFYHDAEVLPYFAGSRPSARMSGAYSLMYFELMRRAAAAGCERFDFGRSIAGTGAFSYKKNWGFEPQPLAYGHIAVKGRVPAQLHPDDWPARLFAGTWRRLPRAVAHRLGPRLSLLAC